MQESKQLYVEFGRLKGMEEKKWLLYSLNENEEINKCKTFDSYAKLVKFCKTKMKKDSGLVHIIDLEVQGTAHFENGEIQYVTSCMGTEDEYMQQHWMNDGKPLNEEDNEGRVRSVWDVYSPNELL